MSWAVSLGSVEIGSGRGSQQPPSSSTPVTFTMGPEVPVNKLRHQITIPELHLPPAITPLPLCLTLLSLGLGGERTVLAPGHVN